MTLKIFRSILPQTALILCFGFFVFITLDGVMAESPVSHAHDKMVNQLVFQPGHQSANSVFTRQASGSELAVSDNVLKSGAKYVASSGLGIQAQAVSAFILIRKNQLPDVAISGGDRTVLYRRFIL